MNNKVYYIFYLFACCIIALYFGISGFSQIELNQLTKKSALQGTDTVTYDSIKFKNKASLELYLEQARIEKWANWAIDMPNFFIMAITSMCFGLIGGLIFEIKKIVIDKMKVIPNVLFLQPVLSLLTGLVVLGLSYVIPTIIVSGETEVRPTTLIAMSLFSGLYSEKFYEWISNLFGTIFKDNNNAA